MFTLFKQSLSCEKVQNNFVRPVPEHRWVCDLPANFRAGRTIMTEIWKDIKGWPEYQVSSFGRVKSKSRAIRHCRGGKRWMQGRMLRLIKRGKYWVVSLAHDGQLRMVEVHTLMLEAFVGPRPNGHCCCHHDDDPTNNTLSNLRWATPKENSLDAMRNGRYGKNKGERHGFAKLNEASVLEIRKTCSKKHISFAALGLLYGVSYVSISAVVHRRSWRHI